MASLEIPIISNEAHFSQEHDIFEQNYYLEFQWIKTEGFWLFDIGYSSNNYLKTGIKLQANWPLYRENNLVFFLIPTKNTHIITRTNLLNNFSLIAHG